LEWFQSPLIYKEDPEFVAGVKKLAEKNQSMNTMSHHHLNIALKHQRLYFTDKSQVFLKKYFYVVRPLLAVKYIKERHKVPPIQVLTSLLLVLTI
jgi:predicted nucleotidyltransferase